MLQLSKHHFRPSGPPPSKSHRYSVVSRSKPAKRSNKKSSNKDILRELKGDTNSIAGTTEFVSGKDQLDGMVTKYSQLLKQSDLDSGCLSTLLCRCISLAERNELIPRIMMTHSDFLVAILESLDVAKLDAKTLSGVVWALGQLGPKARDLEPVRRVLEQSLTLSLLNFDDFEPREVTDLFRGFARLDFRKAQELVPKIEQMCLEQRDRIDSEDISGLASALADLAFPDSRTAMEDLARLLRTKLSTASHSNLVSFVRSCGALRTRIPIEIVSEIVMKIEESIRSLSPSDVCQLLCALSKIPYRPRFEFLDVVEVYFTNEISQFGPSEIANCLEALALFGYAPRTLVEVAKAHIADCKDSFTLRDISIAIYSLAILDELDHSVEIVMSEKFRQLDLRALDGALSADDLIRFNHYLLHLRLIKRRDPSDYVPKELENKCRRTWSSTNARDVSESPAISHVLYNFEYMGYTVESPYFDARSGWMLHCVKTQSGQQFAVEVIDESRCFVNERHRLQGPEKWRHRVLRAVGWPLMIIYEDDWMTMDFDEQANYLTENVLPLLN